MAFLHEYKVHHGCGRCSGAVASEEGAPPRFHANSSSELASTQSADRKGPSPEPPVRRADGHHPPPHVTRTSIETESCRPTKRPAHFESPKRTHDSGAEMPKGHVFHRRKRLRMQLPNAAHFIHPSFTCAYFPSPSDLMMVKFSSTSRAHSCFVGPMSLVGILRTKGLSQR